MPAESLTRRTASTAISWRNGTTGRLWAHFAALDTRVADEPARRTDILSLQPSRQHLAARPPRRHQGALDLRAGASAPEGRTRSRPLRRRIMDRTAPPRADDDDRPRLPAAARTTRHIADRVQLLAQSHSRLPATPRRLRQQRLDLHPLLVRQARRVALCLSAKIGHPASGRSGPHPEFQSLPAAPLQAILKRSLSGP